MHTAIKSLTQPATLRAIHTTRCLATAAAETAEHGAQTARQYGGVFPIVATAFRGIAAADVSAKPTERQLHDAEGLDLDSFARAISFYRGCGVSGVTVCGVLGESNRLLDCERDLLVETALKHANGMKVIVGTSHTGTFAAIELSKRAKALGAHGVMVSPAKEPSPQPDSAIVDLYTGVGETGCEIVLQDHPASTGVFMSVDLIAKIAHAVPAVKAIKLESLPTPGKIAILRKQLPSHVSILTGLGALYAGMDLRQGIDGFMTGFAFPEVLIAMLEAHNQKQFAKRDRIYKLALPLIVCEQQPGVALRKRLYQHRGLFNSAFVRRPAAQLSPVMDETLQQVLDEEGGFWKQAGCWKKPLDVEAMLKALE